MGEPALITEEYRKLQQPHQNPDDGVALVHFAPFVAQVIEAIGTREPLDSGAGKGRRRRNHAGCWHISMCRSISNRS